MVLFFDYLSENESKQDLYKKIWNAQVPVIIFNDINNIKIFNGKSLDLSDINNLKLNLVKEQKINECNEKAAFSYWNITNEKFLADYQKNFSKDTLNEVMLRNIKCITRILKNTYHISFATKLVLRIIFIKFLIDRGVDIGYEGFNGNVEVSQENLLNIVGSKQELYEFFAYLKDKFNGNLFELGNEIEDTNLSDNVFDLLQSFVSGKEEMDTGQLSFLPL